MEIGLCMRVCMCIEVMSGSLIGQRTALEFLDIFPISKPYLVQRLLQWKQSASVPIQQMSTIKNLKEYMLFKIVINNGNMISIGIVSIYKSQADFTQPDQEML